MVVIPPPPPIYYLGVTGVMEECPRNRPGTIYIWHMNLHMILRSLILGITFFLACVSNSARYLIGHHVHQWMLRHLNVSVRSTSDLITNTIKMSEIPWHKDKHISVRDCMALLTAYYAMLASRCGAYIKLNYSHEE